MAHLAAWALVHASLSWAYEAPGLRLPFCPALYLVACYGGSFGGMRRPILRQRLLDMGHLVDLLPY
jgi:hypothetical protein